MKFGGVPGRPTLQTNVCASGAPIGEIWRRFWDVSLCKSMWASLKRLWGTS